MKKFIKGFYYAARGVASCLKSERNMRIHFCAAFYVLIFSRFYDFSAAEYALLFLAIGMVMAAESINTSIEHMADGISPGKSEWVMRAKDAAAGGVLLAAAAALGVGVSLFFDKEALLMILMHFLHEPLAAAALLLSAAIWIIIITLPPGKEKRTEKKDDSIRN